MTKVNFSKQKLPPSQLEVDYWIDLTDDPNGGKIKHFLGGGWINLIPDLVLDMSELKQDVLLLHVIGNNHELRLQTLELYIISDLDKNINIAVDRALKWQNI